LAGFVDPPVTAQPTALAGTVTISSITAAAAAPIAFSRNFNTSV
jgi:hypothetical protein